MDQQSFFFSNTHYSNTHHLHNNNPVATEWFLGVNSPTRASGFQSYGSSWAYQFLWANDT